MSKSHPNPTCHVEHNPVHLSRNLPISKLPFHPCPQNQPVNPIHSRIRRSLIRFLLIAGCLAGVAFSSTSPALAQQTRNRLSEQTVTDQSEQTSFTVDRNSRNNESSMDAGAEGPSEAGDSLDWGFGLLEDGSTEEEVLLENDAVARADPYHLFAEDRTRTVVHNGWTTMHEQNLADIEMKCRAIGYRITNLDLPWWNSGMYEYYKGSPSWNAICVSNTDELYRESWSVFQGTFFELFVHCATTQETVVEIEVLPGELTDKWAKDVRFVAITVAKGSGPGQHPSTMPVTLRTMDEIVKIVEQGYRLIDLDRVEHYYPGFQWDTLDGKSIVRYNAVFIKNSGKNYRKWWWWVGPRLDKLEAMAANQGAHLVDIEYQLDNLNFDQPDNTPALGIAYALEPTELPQGILRETNSTIKAMGLRLIDEESWRAMVGGSDGGGVGYFSNRKVLPTPKGAAGQLTADTQ